MKYRKWAIAALALAVAAPALARAIDVQPGLWEFTATMAYSGGPAGALPQKVTYKSCLKKTELAHPWQMLQNSSEHSSGCKFSDIEVGGSRASWTMKCPESQGHIALYFDSPTRMHEIQDMSMQSSGSTMKMHAEAQGHRVGECPKQP